MQNHTEDKKPQSRGNILKQIGSMSAKEQDKTIYSPLRSINIEEAVLEDELGFKIGRSSNNLCCIDDTTLITENANNLQPVIMNIKEYGKKKWSHK